MRRCALAKQALRNLPLVTSPWCFFLAHPCILLKSLNIRRKFRSQTSDKIWTDEKAEVGRVRKEKRREKIRQEKVRRKKQQAAKR